MKTFWLLIKSHCDTPDLERFYKARTKKEAVEKAYKELGKYGWEKNQIDRNIIDETKAIQ